MSPSTNSQRFTLNVFLGCSEQLSTHFRTIQLDHRSFPHHNRQIFPRRSAWAPGKCCSNSVFNSGCWRALRLSPVDLATAFWNRSILRSFEFANARCVSFFPICGGIFCQYCQLELNRYRVKTVTVNLWYLMALWGLQIPNPGEKVKNLVHVSFVRAFLSAFFGLLNLGASARVWEFGNCPCLSSVTT
jgi:hypothetical protein